jgi:hypothetical protein
VRKPLLPVENSKILPKALNSLKRKPQPREGREGFPSQINTTLSKLSFPGNMMKGCAIC